MPVIHLAVLCLLAHWQGLTKWNRTIIYEIRYTCALPAMTINLSAVMNMYYMLRWMQACMKKPLSLKFWLILLKYKLCAKHNAVIEVSILEITMW